jgi:hypothetical protein
MKFPVLLTLAAGILSTSTAPSTPPIKMGLWESVPAASTGAQAGQPQRTVRSCQTPSTWVKQMGPTAKDACPKTNEVWTANSYSFDVQCSGKPKMASVSVTFDTPETMHGSFDMTAMPDGTPRAMHRDFQQRWVAADCGDVTPEHAVTVVGAASDAHSK